MNIAFPRRRATASNENVTFLEFVAVEFRRIFRDERGCFVAEFAILSNVRDSDEADASSF